MKVPVAPPISDAHHSPRYSRQPSQSAARGRQQRHCGRDPDPALRLRHPRQRLGCAHRRRLHHAGHQPQSEHDRKQHAGDLRDLHPAARRHADEPGRQQGAPAAFMFTRIAPVLQVRVLLF
jgi:hypothetical protein